MIDLEQILREKTDVALIKSILPDAVYFQIIESMREAGHQAVDLCAKTKRTKREILKVKEKIV